MLDLKVVRDNALLSTCVYVMPQQTFQILKTAMKTATVLL